MLDFVVIGVQKCATSWMYETLKLSNDIILPDVKREIDFIGNGDYKYLDKMNLLRKEHMNKLLGDVSVEYIENIECLEELLDINPHCRFIVMLRNPLERSLSALNWYDRKGKMEEESGLEHHLSDIVKRSLYSDYLNILIDKLPRNNIHVIFYEDIKMNGSKVLKDLSLFLDIDILRPYPLALKRSAKSRCGRQMAKNFSAYRLTNVLWDRFLVHAWMLVDDFFRSEEDMYSGRLRSLLESEIVLYKNRYEEIL
jgi:hypothetical protein